MLPVKELSSFFPLIAVAAMEYAVITPGLPSAALVPSGNVIRWLLSDSSGLVDS